MSGNDEDEQDGLRPRPFSYGHNFRFPYIDENIDDWSEDDIESDESEYATPPTLPPPPDSPPHYRPPLPPGIDPGFPPIDSTHNPFNDEFIDIDDVLNDGLEMDDLSYVGPDVVIDIDMASEDRDSLGSSIPPSPQPSAHSSRSAHSGVSSIENRCKICFAERSIDYYVCSCRGTQANICWNCLRTIIFNRLEVEDFILCGDCRRPYTGIEFVYPAPEPRSIHDFFWVYLDMNNRTEVYLFLQGYCFISLIVAGIVTFIIYLVTKVSIYHFLISVAIVWLLLVLYILYMIPEYLRSVPTTPIDLRLNPRRAIPK